MTERLYERYKDALRRGHVAAQRGRHDLALDAYGEASQIAPDRPLPFVGIGEVLTRLGRNDEALAAYDAALDRAPADESALRGRAGSLTSIGDRAAAAETLDRLAAGLEGDGRLADSTAILCRALELAESRGRREAVRHAVQRLQATPSEDPAADDVVSKAMSLLADRVTAYDAPTPGSTPTDGMSAPDGALVSAPAPEPEPEPEPEAAFAPGEATAAVEDATRTGDPAALALALHASESHRANGLHAAAIDACYIALARHPADPDLHLTLTELYLDRGWRTLAADKLVLLARLADLAGDQATHDRVCDVVGTRLPDDDRLAAICR